MSVTDDITFTPWPHAATPGWSLPALEAAKCVARQGRDVFERVDLRLFQAYFTDSVNIGDPAEVTRIVGDSGVDMERFTADYRSGIGRQAVVRDYQAAVEEHGVRSIPTVIATSSGRALVGLADLAAYRALVEESAG